MKAITTICIALCIATQVAALGTRKALYHENVFGKGFEVEQRIKD
jgi:hypothetical protein